MITTLRTPAEVKRVITAKEDQLITKAINHITEIINTTEEWPVHIWESRLPFQKLPERVRDEVHAHFAQTSYRLVFRDSKMWVEFREPVQIIEIPTAPPSKALTMYDRCFWVVALIMLMISIYLGMNKT